MRYHNNSNHSNQCVATLPAAMPLFTNPMLFCDSSSSKKSDEPLLLQEDEVPSLLGEDDELTLLLGEVDELPLLQEDEVRLLLGEDDEMPLLLEEDDDPIFIHHVHSSCSYIIFVHHISSPLRLESVERPR